MSDTVSHTFLNLRHPTLSLVHAFSLPAQGIVHDAVGRVVDVFEDAHTANGKTNLPAAYFDAQKHIDYCLYLFDLYAGEYNLSRAQEETALAAWLCQNCVDPTDPDEWAEIDPEALAILGFMEHDHTVFPLLSDGKKDPALALNIGLQIWDTLTFRTDNYKKPGKWDSSFFCDPDADWRYATTILRDTPAIETALTRQCELKAKALVDTLRSRMRHHFHLV